MMLVSLLNLICHSLNLMNIYEKLDFNDICEILIVSMNIFTIYNKLSLSK